MNVDLHVQVLIVGAGPSGLAAAIRAAFYGLKVAVVEKNSKIGARTVCGEAVQSFVIDELGLENLKSEFCDMSLVKVTSQNFCSHAFVEKVGYIVNKPLMLNEMAIRASRYGAIIFTNARFVDAYRDGDAIISKIVGNRMVQTVKSDIVIGADGVRSAVARVFGFPSCPQKSFRYGINAAVAHRSIENGTVEFIVRKEFGRGYGWVFGKRNGFGNVGVITDKGPHHAETLMESLLKDRFKNNLSILGYGMAAISVGGVKELVRDNVMLVGGAASLVDPFGYAGIWTSVSSGQFAADVAFQAISKGDVSKNALRPYEDGIKSMFGKRWKLLQGLEDIASRFSNSDWDKALSIADEVWGNKKLEDLDASRLVAQLLSKPKFWSFAVRKAGHAFISLVQKTL